MMNDDFWDFKGVLETWELGSHAFVNHFTTNLTPSHSEFVAEKQATAARMHFVIGIHTTQQSFLLFNSEARPFWFTIFDCDFTPNTPTPNLVTFLFSLLSTKVLLICHIDTATVFPLLPPLTPPLFSMPSKSHPLKGSVADEQSGQGVEK